MSAAAGAAASSSPSDFVSLTGDAQTVVVSNTESYDEDPFKGWGVDISSSLIQFAHSRNMIVRAKGGKYTHTFTTGGGKMCLTDTPSDRRDFYMAAAQPRNLNTASEEAEEEFCAYFEVDCPTTWNQNHTDVFLSLVCSVLVLFNPNTFFHLYYSGKASGAPGMHLVTPNLCMTTVRMIKMRRYLIMLAKRDPVFAQMEDWEGIVDRKVYTKAGAHMRMNFSYKATEHPPCFRSGKYSAIANRTCTLPTCKHGYIYSVGNYYHVLRVYLPDGSRDTNEEMMVTGPHLEHRVRQLERTSIRHATRILTPSFTVPADCPQEIDDTTKRYQTKFSLDAQQSRTIGETSTRYTLERDTSIFESIVEFIQQHSGRPEWRYIEIQDIKYTLVGNNNNSFRKYYIYVNPKSPGGTSCINRAPNADGVRQHKTAPIYFVLSSTGLKQKCTAGNKTANRIKVHGKVRSCAQFTSNEIAIRPMSMCRRIFPPVVKTLPPLRALSSSSLSNNSNSSSSNLYNQLRSLSSSRAPSHEETRIQTTTTATTMNTMENPADVPNVETTTTTTTTNMISDDADAHVAGDSHLVNVSIVSDPSTTETSKQSEAEEAEERTRMIKEQQEHKVRIMALKIIRYQDALQATKSSTTSKSKIKAFSYSSIPRDHKTPFVTGAELRQSFASQSKLARLQDLTHPYKKPLITA